MNNRKPLLHGIDVIAVSAESIKKVSSRISGCEHCSPTVAATVEGVLDDVLTKPSGIATYILSEDLRCPACQARLFETTLIQLNESAAASDLSLKSFAPALPETNVVMIDEDTVLEAQSLIAACGHCDNTAEISFDYLLDAISGCDPSQTEYLMCRRAKCPQCFREVNEKSLIIPL